MTNNLINQSSSAYGYSAHCTAFNIQRYNAIFRPTVRAVATDCIVFVGVFPPCGHDNSWAAALSLMKFCRNTFLDNRSKSRECQGYRSKIKVTGPDFWILYHCNIGQKVCVHDNPWTAALSLMIFCTNMYLDNAHEPLHLAWRRLFRGLTTRHARKTKLPLYLKAALKWSNHHQRSYVATLPSECQKTRDSPAQRWTHRSRDEGSNVATAVAGNSTISERTAARQYGSHCIAL